MNIAILIIDMQEALVKGAYQEHKVLENIHAVTERARVHNKPIIYIQHNHSTFEVMKRGQPGWQIHHRIIPEPNDLIVEKTASDAFCNTALESKLRSFGIETIAVAGMMTEYCVDTTARSALSHGFNVILLTDCHTTGDSGLSAQDVISHHNAILPNVVHPNRSIRAISSSELAFT